MKSLTPKLKGNRLGVVIVILVILLLFGLWIGGMSYTLELLKNYLVGVAIGSAILLVMILLRKSPVGKSKLLKRLTG